MITLPPAVPRDGRSSFGEQVRRKKVQRDGGVAPPGATRRVRSNAPALLTRNALRVPLRNAFGEVSYLSEILEIRNFRSGVTPELPGSLTGDAQQIRVSANKAQHRSQLRHGHGRSPADAGGGARNDDGPACRDRAGPNGRDGSGRRARCGCSCR